MRGFDITQLLGKECMLSIIHKTGMSGNDYAMIGNISALGKGMECGEQFNPNFIFNYTDNFDEEWLEVQPQWIQDQIKGTEDYQSKMNQKKFNKESYDESFGSLLDKTDTPF